MDLTRYLKIGLRWWWLMLLAVILSATASYFYSQQQPKVYAAKATLMVGSDVAKALNPNEGALSLSRTLAQVYSELATRKIITQAVVERLGLDMDPNQLSAMINTSIIPSAQLLEIYVLDVHPQRAQVLANAVAEELIRQSPTGSQAQQDREQFMHAQLADLQTKIEETNAKIQSLEDALGSLTSAVEIAETQSQLTELEALKGQYQSSYNQFLANLSENSPNRLTVFEAASEPTSPVAPNVRRNVLIAAVAGLALAVSAIVLLEFFDDTLVWRREETHVLGEVPLLGAVGKNSDEVDKLVTRGEVWSPEADALRNLRSSIFLTAEHSLSSLLVTSSSPGEGKSYVAANLAATIASPESNVAAVIASEGTKVVLIDADLRKPTLHELFDIPNLLGLADVLAMPETATETVLRKALRTTDMKNLFLLPAGRAPLDPGSLLNSTKFLRVLQSLGEHTDLIIIDSAPILEAVETKAIATVTDRVLVVASSGQTRKKTLQRTVNYFKNRPHNNLLGVAFNRVKLSASYNYYSIHARTNLEKQAGKPQPSLLSSVLPTNEFQDEEATTLSLAEVANYLGVSEDTARRWCEQGRISAIKSGRHWTVRLEDLNQFIAVYQTAGVSKQVMPVEVSTPINDDGIS